MTIAKLAQNVVQLLKSQNLRVSFAESCTGGMVTSSIVSVPGSSGVLDLSIVTYANSAKIEYTAVTQEILDTHGAVSQEAATAMASGIRLRSKADIGVGITGIAGPDGGTDSKPVGTVYIAINSDEKTVVERFVFSGDRTAVRTQTATQTLTMLTACVGGNRNSERFLQEGIDLL